MKTAIFYDKNGNYIDEEICFSTEEAENYCNKLGAFYYDWMSQFEK